MDGAERYRRAAAAIDAANGTDPGALDHGRRAADWIDRLDPRADDLQRLAARAHHLRRASLPRSTYPAGRVGYLRWRRDAKERHAVEVGALLEPLGYAPAEVARVQALIRKEGLGSDPAAQTHEDAACLVFLETGLDELADDLGDDKMVEVLRRTARKLSPAGVAAAARLELSPRGRALLERALGTDDT